MRGWVIVGFGWFASACSAQGLEPGAVSTPGASWAAASSRRDVPRVLGPRATGPERADEISRPAKLTSIETPARDVNGAPSRVACVTCHALRPGRLPRSTADLKTFHRGLVFRHGELACVSCHVAGKADTIHLAAGTELPMTEAMQLCTQCHGPQARDYRHGAHGGMTGVWDRKAGARVRNNCLECHDPHSPRYVGGVPVLGPIDRGAPSSHAPHASEEETP